MPLGAARNHTNCHRHWLPTLERISGVLCRPPASCIHPAGWMSLRSSCHWRRRLSSSSSPEDPTKVHTTARQPQSTPFRCINRTRQLPGTARHHLPRWLFWASSEHQFTQCARPTVTRCVVQLQVPIIADPFVQGLPHIAFSACSSASALACRRCWNLSSTMYNAL